MRQQLGPFGETLTFTKKLSTKFKKAENSYWFVDNHFRKHPYFKGMKNISFLNAGENLKTIKSFEKNLQTLAKSGANRNTKIFCVGGGSLGDSIGFLSSIYMRGLKLTMVPTTWLSAVDSSVGGKTALNSMGYKNVIGSFHAPEQIIYSKDFITTSKIKDAEGEILKTLMLNHNKKWSKAIISQWKKKQIDFDDLERFITYKTKIVKKDPKDLKGVRAVLNLGHSLGHAIELEKSLSHGESVKQGCLFSVRWSQHKGLLDSKTAKSYITLLGESFAKIPEDKLRKALVKDKKSTSKQKLKFVFLSDKGPLLKEVFVDALVREYKRQV